MKPVPAFVRKLEKSESDSDTEDYDEPEIVPPVKNAVKPAPLVKTPVKTVPLVKPVVKKAPNTSPLA